MAGSKSDRPNVVVFFTDQQRWDSTGSHGNPLDLTPNFDRMARRGTHFANTFTCQPVCGPARSSLQTGLYATETGVFRNGLALRPGEKTLAHHFRDAGYRTGYIGKWHLASQGVVPEEERGGYEYWLGHNVLEFSSYAYDMVMYDNDNNPVKLPGYRVDAQTDAAIRYINEHRDEPFFLFNSYLDPHHQNQIDDYTAPDGYRERYEGRWTPPDLAALGGSTHQHLGGYWGIIKRIDEAMARVLDALKSLGLAEKTIFLFTSDHGCHFKTRNSEYKRSCHESSIRVPTAAVGPGFTGGGRVRQLVSLVDLPPTILDAAGLPAPETMRGRSAMPIIRGEPAEWPEEVFLQISESQVGRAIRTSRWKYSVSAPDKNGVNDPSADRYVEEFLYDLQADPHELDNRIKFDSHRKVKEILRERLIKRMVQAGEKAPTIEPAPETPSGQRCIREGEQYA